MDDENLTNSAFRFGDPHEEEIYRSLREKIGRGPAAFFRDACRLLSATDPLETRSHLIHHCLRELESALRDALAPATAEELEGEEPDGNHERDVRLILQGLGIPKDSDVAQAWLAIPGSDNPLQRAHRRRLTVRRVDEQFERLWRNFKKILSVVLDRFEARYVPVFDVLDELLEKKIPSASDLNTLLGEIPNNAVTLGYFFDRLEHPGWLGPLRAEGVFRDLPSPIEPVNEEGNVRFPSWPASRYLASMASEDPETVQQIVQDIPRTENPNVYRQLAEVILCFPPAILASVAEDAASWLERPYVSPLLPNELAKAVVRLAEAECAAEALRLARAVFDVEPQSNGDTSLIRPTVDTHFHSAWQFSTELETVSEALLDVAREEWLRLVGDVLEEVVGAFVEARGIAPPEDHSSIWRSAIESQGQGVGDREIKQTLLNIIRDTAEDIASTNEDQLGWVIGELEDRPYRIFHRVSLHLLRSQCTTAIELIEARILDRALFEDSTVAHEYFLLLQECWGSLTEEAQLTYLTFVEAGPRAEGDEELLTRWEYSRLLPIREHLTNEWRDRFNDLNETYGPAEDHDLPGARRFKGGFVERSSPVSVDELSGMSVEEVVEFARGWKPSEEFMAPTPAELGQTIANVVQEEPAEFASQAELFRSLEPVYVSFLFHGLAEAVKVEHPFEWTPVLNLGKWAVAQDREPDLDEVASLGELPGWKEVRKSIARLLREALKDRKVSVPWHLRDHVWELLHPLTSDSDPTPETEAKYMTPEFSPFSLSINTVRGEAIHAAFDFLSWVQRCLEEDQRKVEGGGIALVSAIQAVLEDHLNPAEDRSLAIRSIYGQRFPSMVGFDPDWAEKCAPRVFPSDADSEEMWKAAWVGYINWNRPWTNVVPLLLDHYAKALRLIDDMEAERVRHRLAEHLMTLYWWSEPELPLKDEDGLMSRFFSVADDSLRAKAIQYIGRSLSRTDEEIPSGILHRLQTLWDWRLARIRESSVSIDFAEELKAYGYWLTSATFDWEWCLERFIETLRLCPQAGFDLYYPIATLSDLAEDFPLEVIRAVELILMRDAERWGVTARREELRELFTTVLQSSDPNSATIATELINRLAAHGHFDFRSLLSEEQSS